MAWLWGFQQQKYKFFFVFKGCVCVMIQWGLIGFYDDDDDDDDVLIYTYVIL